MTGARMRFRRVTLPVIAVAALGAIAFFGTRGREGERRTSGRAAAPAAEAPVGAQGKAARAFGGRVRPAAPAAVRYYDHGNGAAPMATTWAGEDGSFRFSGSVAEPGVLLAEADGFRPGWLVMQGPGDVEILLEPGGPLRYRVTDPEGRPVAGAEVEVWYRYHLSGRCTRCRRLTDDDGFVELNPGPEERLTVTAEGFDPRTIANPERAADDRRRTIVLAPRPGIGGRVVDPEGRPVAGADLRWRKWPGETIWSEAPAARADGTGRFETPPLPLMEHEIRAAAEGFAEARARAWPGDAEVELRLERPASLEGRLLLPGGAPAAGAEIWAEGLDPVARAAADGSFRLGGIPPGTVDLHGYWWGPVDAPEAPDETTWRCSWRLELKSGEARRGVTLTLSGACYSWVPLRLVDERGAPLAGIPVDTGSLSTLGDEEPRTDADGFVRIRTEDAPGYETRFGFSAEGNSLGVDRSCRIRTLPPGTTEVIEVTLPSPIRVTFVLLDREGAPIPAEAGPTLSLDPGDEHAIEGDRVEVPVAPDPDDPRVEYAVRARGFAGVQVPDWVPDRAAPTIEIRLEPAATLRGRVLSGDGIPLAGMRVNCAVRGATNGAGAFELDGLSPGPALLSVRDPESFQTILRRPIDLQSGVNDLGDLTLPPPAIVTGRVTDSAGRPVGGATIEHLDPEMEPRVVATTRPDGVFFVRAHEPARARWIARKAGFGAAVAGGGSELEVALPPDEPMRLRVPEGIDWGDTRILLPDGSRIRPLFGEEDDPEVVRLVQLPPSPLTIEFLSAETGRVVAACTDRKTVVPCGPR